MSAQESVQESFEDGEEASGDLEKRIDIVLSEQSDRSALMIMSGGARRLHLLEHDETIIGRDEAAQLTIDQRSISLRHAKIVRRGSQHFVSDLGSTNGTFVNKQPVTGEWALRHSDLIWVGEVVLAFLQEGESEGDGTVALARSNASPIVDPQPSGVVIDARAAGGVVPGSIEPEPQPALDFLRNVMLVYRFFRRNLWVLLLPAVLGIALGTATIQLVPPRDEAHVELSLRPAPRDTVMSNDWSPPKNDNELITFFLNAERNFTHEDLVRGTLKELGYEDPSGLMVEEFAEALELNRLGENSYLGIAQKGYMKTEPPKAVDFLAAHTKHYIQAEIDKTLAVLTQQASFLRDQTASAEAELQAIESRLLNFKEKNLKGLPEQKNGTYETRFDLITRRTELSAQISRFRMGLKVARQRLKGAAPLVTTRVQSTAPYRARLTEINRRIGSKKAQGLSDQHPEVVQLRSEASNLQRLIDETVAKGPNEIDRTANVQYQALKSQVSENQVQLRAAQQEAASVNASLSKLNEVLSLLPGVESRLEELTRQQAQAKKYHKKLDEELKSAELQLQLERTSASARYEIILPPANVALNRTLFGAKRVGMGLALGLVLGLLIAGMRELRFFFSRHAESIRSLS